MNIQEAKAAVEGLLTRYSTALNSSDTGLLSSLYSENGVFMPTGFHAIACRDAIRHSAERFFKHKKLNISFQLIDITVDGDYAFVHATSKCAVFRQSTDKKANNSNKDFFVFRKEQQQWKVYQYMFNDN